MLKKCYDSLMQQNQKPANLIGNMTASGTQMHIFI